MSRRSARWSAPFVPASSFDTEPRISAISEYCPHAVLRLSLQSFGKLAAICGRAQLRIYRRYKCLRRFALFREAARNIAYLKRAAVEHLRRCVVECGQCVDVIPVPAAVFFPHI